MLALAVAAAGAQAQDMPQTTPTRDVDITYRVMRAGQTLQERTRWLAAEQKERVDPPGAEDAYVIIDHRARTMAMVNTQAQTVLEAAGPPPGPLEQASTAHFTRRGEDTVAGLPCTEWETGNTLPTTLCLTADGVLLRLRSGTTILAEAVAVQYGSANPSAFRIPASYRHMTSQAPAPQ